MKDPKNIEILNKLVMNYITLHGLQGKTLSPNDPFAIYFSKILMSSLSPVGGSVVYSINDGQISLDDGDEFFVPNKMLHPMIKLAYDFYCNMDDFKETVNPMMKEQVKFQLGEDIKFDDFLEDSVESYKKYLFQLLDNYNSNREEYINIKINILEDKMKESVEVENYEMAAEMRDKIADMKKRLQ